MVGEKGNTTMSSHKTNKLKHIWIFIMMQYTLTAKVTFTSRITANQKELHELMISLEI